MWVHKEVTLPLIEEAESIEVEIYELKKKIFKLFFIDSVFEIVFFSFFMVVKTSFFFS